jgi:hypothetical protein
MSGASGRRVPGCRTRAGQNKGGRGQAADIDIKLFHVGSASCESTHPEFETSAIKAIKSGILAGGEEGHPVKATVDQALEFVLDTGQFAGQSPAH